MPEAFLTGIGLSLCAFLYSTIYRYRGLEPRFDETRLDRTERVLSKVDWLRVVGYTIVCGVFTFTLWHGLSDIIHQFQVMIR